MVTLVGFVIYSKNTKSSFFYEFTIFYGWLNIFVLCALVLSGVGLIYIKELYFLLFEKSELSTLLWIKIGLVLVGIVATFIHSYIVLHVKRRTAFQHLISKISSFYLLFSSLLILYLAIKLRDLV